ncbi:MAG: hypothetical protein JWO93_410, partial [Micrococcaceae bacterium]|nr:hypothetical protein [Micrococcaceae bacterium]
MAAPDGENPSGSVGRALQWAQVLVALRGRGPIGVDELFVGLLLAHADAQGEVRQLLDHFGLTARDVLPDEFPEVTVEALRAAASSPIAQERPTWDASVSEVLAVAGSLAAGEARLPHVLGALLQRSTPLRQALQLGLDRYGYNVQQLAENYVGSLPQLNLGSSVPAGTQIGQWLASSFPISPPNLASFANDAVDATLDFVNIGVEADAFAYLIASKALVPPLAIGLFGHWGSGKSFLMAKIRTRIRQLTDLAQRGGGGEVQVWGNVAHIEFNAWQYVETNLWAALLHHIFSALSPEALERLSERRRAASGLELAEQKLKLDAKAEEVARLSKAGTEQTGKVRSAELVLQARQKEAHLDRNGLIASKLEDTAQAQLVKTMLATSDRILGPETTEALDETRRLATAAMASPWQRTAFWTKRRIAYVGAGAILVPVAAYVVESWLGSDLAGLLAGVAAVAPSVAALMRAGANFAEEQRRQLATATAEVDEELTRRIHEAKGDVEEARKTLEATLEALTHARKDVEEAQSTVEQLTKRREETTAASSLADFVRDRGESADYRRLLTEVTMVNRDLKDLAELTTEYNAASITQPGGPPNRIVLYIDDLDRCPPERVVDVLEAVHLLLSFELFVVVVAVDTRWLTSALHQGLSALSDAEDPQD